MHQFECRVWDPYKCVMHYDYRDISCWNGVLVAEGDSIILLYSGLRDKKHVKMYQMDIIKHAGVLKVIVWHMGGLVVVDENAMLDSTEGWYVAERLENLGPDVEVVGNMYQHKHLLRRFK